MLEAPAPVASSTACLVTENAVAAPMELVAPSPNIIWAAEDSPVLSCSSSAMRAPTLAGTGSLAPGLRLVTWLVTIEKRPTSWAAAGEERRSTVRSMDTAKGGQGLRRHFLPIRISFMPASSPVPGHAERRDPARVTKRLDLRIAPLPRIATGQIQMCPDRSDEGCGGLPLPVLARQREETRHRERNVISDLRPRPFEEKPQALGQGQGRIDEPPLLVLVVRPPLEAAGDDSPIRVLVRVAVAGTQIPFRPPEIEVLGQPRGERLVGPSLQVAEIGPVLVNEIELGRCHGPPRNRRAEGGDMRAAEGLAVEPCVGASTLKDDRDRRVVDGGHANVPKRSVDIAACVVPPGELNEPLRRRLIERLEIVVSRA